MSLAPASNRGAFLKARLAVNGIQCAARSLGTLTAAGSGLLSSIGAFLSFRISGIFWVWRRSPKDISFVAKRERHDRLYLWSVGWFEGAQGDIKCPGGLNRRRRSRTPRPRTPRYRATAAAIAEMRLRACRGHGRSRTAARPRASDASRSLAVCGG